MSHRGWQSSPGPSDSKTLGTKEFWKGGNQTLAETQDPDHHESEPGSRTLVSCCARGVSTVEDDPANYTLMIGPPPLVNQPISLTSIKWALSEERLQAYATKGDSDSLDAVARYIWNLAPGAAMQPLLHVLEITFRNHIFDNSVKFIDESKLKFHHVDCWLDADPTLLEGNEVRSVDEAKETLLRRRKPLTPGRLIARLGFGFWTGLCNRPYEQGRSSGPALWPAMLNTGFPFLVRAKRTRAQS